MRAVVLSCAWLLVGCASSTVVGRAPLTNGSKADIIVVPLSLSNVHVVRTRVPVLIDTGTVGDMEDLGAALEERGVSTSGLGLIIVTHAHADHAGLAADLQRLSRAPVVLGAGDVSLAAAGHNDELKPTGFAGRLLKPFIRSVYAPFVPDITVSPGEPLDLAPWGIDGKVMAMPGHTAGSVVVVLADHTAFVGDMMAGWGEHLYQADRAQNRKNIQTLLDLGVTKFYVGHGGPLSRVEVLADFP